MNPPLWEAEGFDEKLSLHRNSTGLYFVAADTEHIIMVQVRSELLLGLIGTIFAETQKN